MTTTFGAAEEEVGLISTFHQPAQFGNDICKANAGEAGKQLAHRKGPPAVLAAISKAKPGIVTRIHGEQA